MLELFKEVWSTLKQNKLRTALTGFAVAWGIFMLIVLLGAGNGVFHAFTANENMLSNSMTIYGSVTSKPYKGYDTGRLISLKRSDMDLLRSPELAEVVDEVSAEYEKSDTLVFNDFHAFVNVDGVSPLEQKIGSIQLYSGRFINKIDEEERRRVVVIPSNLVDQIKGQGSDYSTMVGEYMNLGDLRFKVVGVYKSLDVENNIEVYCPFETITAIYKAGDNVESIKFTFHGLLTPAANENFIRQLRSIFNLAHDADPEDNSAIYVFNSYTAGQSLGKAERAMRIALWVLGIMTLLSGIVGVSNIMLITVKERTHEFGIRKAIGAKPKSILSLILVESVAITAFFGYIGMGLGVFATKFMDAKFADHPTDVGIAKVTMFVDPTVGMDVAFEATLLLIAAGTIAGLIPAWKAAHVKPIQALAAK